MIENRGALLKDHRPSELNEKEIKKFISQERSCLLQPAF
jgi:hypothetical protein